VHQERECAQQATALASAVPRASPRAAMPPVTILFAVVAEVVPSADIDHAAYSAEVDAAEPVGARTYQFPTSRDGGRRR
jgi:hypothetical protein